MDNRRLTPDPPDPARVAEPGGGHVTLSIANFLRWAGALIVLFALTTFAMGLAQYFGSDEWAAVLSPLDSGAEASVPTWFSTALLGLAGLVALAITGVTAPGADRRGWTLLAIALILMSVDEGAALHERLIDPLREGLGTSGLLYFAWVIPGALVVVAFAVVMFPFWRRLPAATRTGLLAGVGIFLAGAIGLEMIGGLFLTSVGVGPFTAVTSLAEEALEMAGSTVLLGVLLHHLRRVAPDLRLELR